MYRFTKDNKMLATLTNPVWVRMQDNGSYGLCSVDDAAGVVIEGTVYHIANRDTLSGCEDVIVSIVSELEYQQELANAQKERQIQTDSAIAELSILIATGMTSPVV